MAAGRGEGGIEFPMRDARKPQRERKHLGLRQHAGGKAGEFVEITFGAGEPGAFKRRAAVCRDCGAVKRGALALDREEHLIGHRRKKRGQYRTAVLDQRHRDGPVGAAGDIGAGAVDRIHDPGQRQGAVGQGFGLLRQPAGVGHQIGEPRAQQIVDRDVALAHKRIVVALGPALEGSARGRARQIAGLAHHGFERRAQAGKFIAHDLIRKPVPTFRDHAFHCPATVKPSSRTVGALVP